MDEVLEKLVPVRPLALSGSLSFACVRMCVNSVASAYFC